ncbi:MAG: hypothetical protein AAF557_15170 [Pseudomonadota bacterium]
MSKLFYFCLGMIFIMFVSWTAWHLAVHQIFRGGATSTEYRLVLNEAIRQGQQLERTRRAETPTVRRRVRSDVEVLETRATGQIRTDVSQVFFLIRSNGRTAGTVASQLSLKRDAIKAEINSRGFQDVTFDEIDIKIEPNRRYRYQNDRIRKGQQAFHGAMQLSVTFHGSPDILTIASWPAISRNAEIRKTLFWFSDFDEKMAPLKELAREKLEAMAAEKFGEREFEISSIDFKNSV